MSVGLEEFEAAISQELQSSGTTAKEIILAMNDFELEYKKYSALMRRKREGKRNQENISSIRQEIQALQEPMYASFLRFQNLFNLYFNQIIVMMFVYRDENSSIQLGVSENSLEHAIMNKYGKLQYEINGLENALILEQDNYDSTLLDETANSVYERFDTARSISNKPAGLPVLWKDGGSWQGAIVNNRGTIAEAYANFYINQYEFSGGLEHRVGIYVTDDEHGMMSVDNTMGFFIGDVQHGSEKSIQYAVKTQGASLLGVAKVYSFIKKIKQELGSEITDESVIQALKEKVNQQGKVKQVKKILSGEIENTYDELIELLKTNGVVQ